MTALLLESPWPGVVGGALLACMLAAGWTKTGDRRLLVAAAAALMGGALLVVIERSVVTDREQVINVVHQLARAVEENRMAEVLAAVHPYAPEIRQRVEAEMPRHTFQSVDVKPNLRVEMQPEKAPPRAVATFNVTVELEEFPRVIPRFVSLTFQQRDDGQWALYDYYHAEPQQGLQRRDPEP